MQKIKYLYKTLWKGVIKMKAVIIILKDSTYGSRQEQSLEIFPSDVKCVVDWEDRWVAINMYLKQDIFNLCIDARGYIREDNHSDYGYIYGICQKVL